MSWFNISPSNLGAQTQEFSSCGNHKTSSPINVKSPPPVWSEQIDFWVTSRKYYSIYRGSSTYVLWFYHRHQYIYILTVHSIMLTQPPSGRSQCQTMERIWTVPRKSPYLLSDFPPAPESGPRRLLRTDNPGAGVSWCLCRACHFSALSGPEQHLSSERGVTPAY